VDMASTPSAVASAPTTPLPLQAAATPATAFQPDGSATARSQHTHSRCIASHTGPGLVSSAWQSYTPTWQTEYRRHRPLQRRATTETTGACAHNTHPRAAPPRRWPSRRRVSSNSSPVGSTRTGSAGRPSEHQPGQQLPEHQPPPPPCSPVRRRSPRLRAYPPRNPGAALACRDRACRSACGTVLGLPKLGCARAAPTRILSETPRAAAAAADAATQPIRTVTVNYLWNCGCWVRRSILLCRNWFTGVSLRHTNETRFPSTTNQPESLLLPTPEAPKNLNTGTTIIFLELKCI
jgi:hypothetical protein